MFNGSTLSVLLATVLLISSIPDAASYTKYGRTCKDIGCRRDEVCVMAEDPCSIYQRDNCGRYPTCAKTHPGEANCVSTVCGENEYCKTENGVPTCVQKSNAIGYDSAGVSSVNGHRINTNEKHDKSSNSASDLNPYANANAPPAPVDPAGGYHQANAGNNLGYPPYPSNTGFNTGSNVGSNIGSNSGYPPYPSNSGSNSGYPPYPSNSGSNSGYPPYPSTNQGNMEQNSRYPPYPTHNRMPPMPEHPGQASYPGYPGQSAYPVPPGYPQQYPGYQNYPNQNRMHTNNVYSGYRRNDGIVQTSSMIVCLASLVIVFMNRS